MHLDNMNLFEMRLDNMNRLDKRTTCSAFSGESRIWRGGGGADIFGIFSSWNAV